MIYDYYHTRGFLATYIISNHPFKSIFFFYHDLHVRCLHPTLYLMAHLHTALSFSLSLSFFLSFFLCVCVSSAGGEDRKLRIWDLRKPDQALTVLGAHSHWVWTVKYNRFHDQLLLSAGSSSSVNLWSVVSVSSAPLGRDLSQTNPTYTTT